jgi:hypothetical protein
MPKIPTNHEKLLEFEFEEWGILFWRLLSDLRNRVPLFFI